MASCWKRGGTQFCSSPTPKAGMKCKRNPKTGHYLCVKKRAGFGSVEGPFARAADYYKKGERRLASGKGLRKSGKIRAKRLQTTGTFGRQEWANQMVRGAAGVKKGTYKYCSPRGGCSTIKAPALHTVSSTYRIPSALRMAAAATRAPRKRKGKGKRK